MKRDKWKMQFTGANILRAVTQQVGYHRALEKRWADEQKQVHAQLKEKGVEIREYQVTGGTNVVPVLDQPLLARYGELGQKIASHRKSAEEYEQWQQIMRHQPETMFALHWDDVLFFGIGKEPKQESAP